MPAAEGISQCCESHSRGVSHTESDIMFGTREPQLSSTCLDKGIPTPTSLKYGQCSGTVTVKPTYSALLGNLMLRADRLGTAQLELEDGTRCGMHQVESLLMYQ